MMVRGLRVLYMGPSGYRAGELSRYSFLDEEIRALADAGIDAYVLSAVDGDWDRGRVHMRRLPEDSTTQRVGTLSFLARHIRHVPLANLADPQQCYRALRIERFASRVIEREGVSLIHSYFGWPRGYGGRLAKSETGVPLVAGLRGTDVNIVPELRYGFRLDPSYDRAVRRLLRGADRTVSVSEFLRRKAEALGARPETACVILKGVHLETFTAADDRLEARQRLALGCQPLILSVGGLTPIKGLPHVLDALRIVHASGRTFSFISCGEGPDRSALEAQARSLGLADCTTFRGRVPRSEIGRYFRAADLLVHGSIIEASGNVLLEAMASGIPIVCTDAGGPAEYVRDGGTGFVVPVADPAAMAHAIVRLLDDPALRVQFGRAGREHAQTHFAYGRMINDTLDVYRSVLGDAKTHRAAGDEAIQSHLQPERES